MKTFLKVLISIMLMLPFVGFSQNFGSHIVADGMVTNRYVPIYGFYADSYMRSQTIYPDSMLVQLRGATVTHLTYYLQTLATQEWGVDFEVRVGETPATILNGFDDTTLMQTVFTGALNGMSSTMTITLDTPFTYTGGNLIVEIRSLNTGDYSDVYFYGIQSSNSSSQGRNGSSVEAITGSTRHFIPKVDFYALDTLCVSPATITVREVTSFRASFSWPASTTSTAYQVTCGDRTFRVTDTTIVIDSLAPDTDYQVELRSICSGGDTSDAVSCEFHTYCAPFVLSDTSAFSEDFETGIGSCWSNFHLSGRGSSLWNISNSLHHSGTSSACLPDQLGITRTMLITQPIVVPTANDYQLSFWVYKVSYVPQSYQSRTDEGIRVWANTTPDTIGATELYYYHRNSDVVDVAGFSLCEAIIPQADTLFLIFEGISQYSGALYIDDIEVSTTSTCPRPTNLVSQGALSNRVTVGWMDNAGLAWKLRYRERSSENWISVNATLYQKSYTLRNLTPKTDYELQIRGVCRIGDTSGWSNSLFFTTACEAIERSDLPYVEDFESYSSGINSSINPCWYKITNSTTPYPYPTSMAAITGSEGLYFYAMHSADTSQRSLYSYVSLPPLSDSIDLTQLTLDFKLKRYDASVLSITTQIQVGLMSNPLDPETFVSLSDIDLYDAAPDSVVPVTINLSTAGQNPAIRTQLSNYRFLAFFCPVPTLYGGELSHNFALVDDVSLYLSPSCYPPDSVAFDNVSATSAMLTFVPQGYATMVRYRPDFDTNWTYLDTIFNSQFSILNSQFSDLEPATRYYVQLKTICTIDSADVDSRYSDIYTFTTLHGLPYAENFADPTLPSGWSNHTTLPEALTGAWEKSTLLGNSIKSNIYSSGAFWVVAPTIDLAADTNACLSFGLAVADFNSATAPGVGEPDSDDFFRVLISTDGGEHWEDTITWGVGAGYDYDFSSLSNVYTPVIIPLKPYAHANVTVAFRTESGAMSSDFDVHVSQFLAYSPSPCPRPTDVRVDGISDQCAVLHWNTEVLSQLRYRPQGTSLWYTIDSVPNLQISDPGSQINSYQLTNLQPSTQYSVQVRSLCPPDSASSVAVPSDWVEFPNFTTLCTPENLPYQPLFDEGIPGCWQIAVAQYQPDTLVELQPTASGWYVSSRLMTQNHLAINLYGASCRYWVVSPLLAPQYPSQISFDAALTAFGSTGRPSSVGADDRLLVLATVDDGLTWQTIAVFDGSQTSELGLALFSNTPRHFEIPIPFDPQHAVRVALYAESSEINADNDLHIANILFSRSILPEDTVHLSVSGANLVGFPTSRTTYTVSGYSDEGGYSASVAFSVPAAQGLNGPGPYAPIVLDAQLSHSGTPLPLIKSTIREISKTDSSISVDACLIDADTLCYHFDFHYTIPLVTVTLNCDSLQGAISILDSQFSTLNSQFSVRLGDTLTIFASPLDATCYHFVAWGDGDTNNVRHVLLVGDTSFLATFASTLVYESDTALEVCNSYTWFDSVYTLSGNYTYQSQPLNGCDSVATLNLTIRYDTFDTIVDAVCDSLYWILADTTIFHSGGYDFLLLNGFGCDSSVTLQLTVNPSVVDSVTIEISNAELPYTYNNIVLDSFGVYPFHLSTIEGCDSLVVLSLQHLLQINNAANQQPNVLTVSPNPTKGRLTVSHPQFEYCELFDLQGRKMLYSREAEIDISQLPAAVYTLRIVTTQGSYLHKVVKQER